MWRPFYPKFFISIYMPCAWRIYDLVEEMNSCHFCEREKKRTKKRQLCKTYNYHRTCHPSPTSCNGYFMRWRKRRTWVKKINVEKRNRKEKHEIISSNKKERNKMYYKYKHVVLFNRSHIVMMMMMCRYICSKTKTRSSLLYFCFISSILFLMKNEDLHILFNLSHKFFIIASNVCVVVVCPIWHWKRTNQIWNECVRGRGRENI